MKTSSSLQSLAKLTVNFQSSLSICDSTGEATNSTATAGSDPCGLQQYCDTGCQTDIMGEVGHSPVGGRSELRLSWTPMPKSREISGIISPLFTAKLRRFFVEFDLPHVWKGSELR